MDADQTDPRYQTPKDLAGPHYEEMMRSKEAALEYLFAPDCKVRSAAILICESTWNCGPDPKLVEACRNIADSGDDDFFRLCAIHALGRALSSSKAPDASRFLATLATNSANSIEVRTHAYWALREIQFGLADVDLDTFLKGTVCTIKSILRAYPGRFSEDSVKSDLLPEGRFPEGFWDSAEQIDLDFVRQFT